MSEPNISKLPKWAQEEIASRDRAIETLKATLADIHAMYQVPLGAARQDRCFAVWQPRRSGWVDLNEYTVVPSDRIHAVLAWKDTGEYPTAYVQLSWADDGGLRLNASHMVTIEPNVTNDFTIRLRT